MENKRICRKLFLAVIGTIFGAGVLFGGIRSDARELSFYVGREEEQDIQSDDNLWEDEEQEWSFDVDGTLTISGTGNLYTGYWGDFEEKKYDVKKIVVNVTGATHLWLDSYDFPNVEILDLSGFDSNQVTDMSRAFSGLAKLKTIDFGDFDTGNVTDMSGMFSGCSSLTSLDLRGFHTEKVTDMSSMFYECRKLSGLDLSSFDTGKVTEMNQMFYGCNSLSKLNLDHLNTGNVRKMYSMFSGCVSLNSLNLNNWDTGKVTDMSYLFCDCSGLTSLDLSRWNTENVIEMYGMFSGCNSLKEIDISNFNLSNIELEKDNAGKTYPISIFGRVDNLEKIKAPADLPERVDFPYSDTIPENMVEYWKDESGAECEYIKQGLSAAMTYTRALRRTSVEEPPTGQGQQIQNNVPLPAGTKITDHASMGKYVVTGKGTVAYAGTEKASAKSITIPKQIVYLNVSYKMTAINAKALKGNKNVTGIKVDSNVTKIGNSAFENCVKLKSITIGKGVSSIGKSVFKGCKNLKKIIIQGTKLKSVGKNAFKNIHKNCKIKVPASKVNVYKKKLKGKGQKASVKIGK